MNSLAYLSRQFDVLASAKTPPSTPTSERPSFMSDGLESDKTYSNLQRVSTWSTKSFLFSPSSRTSISGPKRSFSSPNFTSLEKFGIEATTPSTAPSDVQIQPPSRLQLEHIIRRVFFIRIFTLAWDNLRAALSTLWNYRGRALLTFTKITQPDGEISTAQDVVYHHPIVNNIEPSTSPPVTVSRTSTDPIPSPKSIAEDQVPQNVVASLKAGDTPLTTSRSSTPLSGTRKPPFHLPKTLVLDLDETLIHSTSRPMHYSSTGGSGLFGLGTRNKGASHMVEVVLGGKSTLYHVYKRPFVDFFLRTVSGWYTLVIFTASMQEYADPVIDWLDAGRGILGHRFFRDLPNGSFTKDLTLVEADLSRVCLVDNSPVSYRVNEANGIPIEGWTHDPSDEALLDLLPFLDSLRFTSDVRRVLGLRTAGSSPS